ncbi:MAG TPA: carbohydrate ABC transporter permease [Candidatus Limnocylindrales bacterium]|jgi:multiple sugar transport system permease protein|nr:carbohydrate ABC transporter permease [Candidatus Limnocylindrales bacterium]
MTEAARATPVVVARPEVAPVGDRGRIWRRRLAYAILIAYALLMFVPFAWTVITSFKTLPDSTRLTIIPQPFTTEAWEYALARLEPSVVGLFANSLFIATVVTLTNLVLGSLAGYAFARLRFPGREALFLLVLATLMIPDQLRLVPVYILFSGLGLTIGTGQYVAVILISAISATSIFLLRQYFLTIPRDLEEAAKIDGAGFFTTFYRVMLPLATPALAAVTILQFQGTWNSFFWPVVFLSPTPEHWTLPLGLTLFRLTGGFGTNWPPLMATVVIATIPILVLYIFFQRYFVEGIAATGVKG